MIIGSSLDGGGVVTTKSVTGGGGFDGIVFTIDMGPKISRRNLKYHTYFRYLLRIYCSVTIFMIPA